MRDNMKLRRRMGWYHRKGERGGGVCHRTLWEWEREGKEEGAYSSRGIDRFDRLWECMIDYRY